MTIFDLLFLASAAASLIALITAAACSLRGRNAAAGKIVWRWGVCALAYLTISALVDFGRPQRVMSLGEPWCFDDWCLTAEQVDHPGAGSYDIQLRISSTAGRVEQRAKGAWIYLLDDRGNRYAPDANPSATPLDVLLEPGESVETARRFHLPANARAVGLLTGHGGSYCDAGSLLIIGNGGCLFGKPAMIRIE